MITSELLCPRDWLHNGQGRVLSRCWGTKRVLGASKAGYNRHIILCHRRQISSDVMCLEDVMYPSGRRSGGGGRCRRSEDGAKRQRLIGLNKTARWCRHILFVRFLHRRNIKYLIF